MTRIKKDSEFFGYHKNPCSLNSFPAPQRHKENMNTDLRFTAALRQWRERGPTRRLAC